MRAGGAACAAGAGVGVLRGGGRAVRAGAGACTPRSQLCRSRSKAPFTPRSQPLSVGAHTAGLDRQADAASGACSLLQPPAGRPLFIRSIHP